MLDFGHEASIDPSSVFRGVDRPVRIGEHDQNNNAEVQGPRLRNLIEACDWSSLIWETTERAPIAGGSERQERTWLFRFSKAARNSAGIKLGIG